MAPNFLSKLVKPPTGQLTRDRSLSSPTPPSISEPTASRTPSTFESSSSSSTNGSTLGNSLPGNHPRSSTLFNPSLSVIPPTPIALVTPDVSQSSSIDGLPASGNRYPFENRRPASKSRPTTPKASPRSSPRGETPLLPPLQTSKTRDTSKAVSSLAPALEIHRAVTSPSPMLDDDEDEYNALTESPVAMRAMELSPASSPGRSSPRRDTELPNNKSRSWRKNTSKKPVGLAGALAATGLAMANHGMSAHHQSTLSPQVMNSGGSDNRDGPSLVTSPNPNPSLSRRGTNVVSPDLGTRPVPLRSRTTGSLFEERHGYFSGLEDSSDDDGNSESDVDSGSALDDLADDIPVTGFAVASNKRNAEFHELFPGVPEGDYLIDDYGCALQREILIQGRIYVSENHLCFHANILGWVTDLSIPIYEITTLEKRMTAFVIPNAIRIKTDRADCTFASFLSRDTTFDVIHNIWRLVRPTDAASVGSGSLEAGTGIEAGIEAPGAALQQHKATNCACSRDGGHFSETALDIVIPGTPERIYNLVFASGFIKDFMAVNQKLMDIQVSDWTPIEPDSKLLARNMSYIKPLNGSIGPKSTKCEIRDEIAHIEFDEYVSMLTTTRTPDVPSGGVFSVKTRTCITWCTSFSSKVVVTTQVDWTGRSFIKGIIEKSAIDGQKVYHSDLDKAMREYIKDHQSEFMPQGVDIVVVPEPSPAEATAVSESASALATRDLERRGRGLQWAWDTFAGASQVTKQSTKGALELLRDAWDNSNSTSILYGLIFVLVISNIWTYLRMGSAVHVNRKLEKARAKAEKEEQLVAGVVNALWDELAAGRLPQAVPTTAASLKQEVTAILSTLDTLEQRVRLIRENLGTLD
ncbi:unnamed protein product [Mycena citricolor]|uniref:VASt domain-containing protein n=1 Tax=Mycena citricolor TaxID=2018698 RepID=A0AAD2HGC4_9AGAR|nr:unnamed protein product [Mycena citricolor]CAK5276296.1 unnamed protein product [Mycena citricolor]